MPGKTYNSVATIVPTLLSLRETLDKCIMEAAWNKNNLLADTELEAVANDVESAAHSLQRLSILIAVPLYDPKKETFQN